MYFVLVKINTIFFCYGPSFLRKYINSLTPSLPHSVMSVAEVVVVGVRSGATLTADVLSPLLFLGEFINPCLIRSVLFLLLLLGDSAPPFGEFLVLRDLRGMRNSPYTRDGETRASPPADIFETA